MDNEQKLIQLLRNNPDLTISFLENIKKASSPSGCSSGKEEQNEKMLGKSTVPQDSESDDEDKEDVKKNSSYSCEELLARRKKNQKASPAQQTFRVSQLLSSFKLVSY